MCGQRTGEARRERLGDPLVELLDAQPSGSAVLAQLGDHGVALGVGGAQVVGGQVRRVWHPVHPAVVVTMVVAPAHAV